MVEPDSCYATCWAHGGGVLKLSLPSWGGVRWGGGGWDMNVASILILWDATLPTCIICSLRLRYVRAYDSCALLFCLGQPASLTTLVHFSCHVDSSAVGKNPSDTREIVFNIFFKIETVLN